MMEIRSDKSFFQQFFVEQPASSKALAFAWMAVFSAVAVLLDVVFWVDQPVFQPGSAIECLAVVKDGPSTTRRSSQLLTMTTRLQDASPACKQGFSAWGLRGFDFPVERNARALMKGMPVRVLVARDADGDYRMLGVKDSDGRVVLDEMAIRRGIDLFNAGGLLKTGFYLVAGVVCTVLCFWYRRKAAREREAALVES